MRSPDSPGERRRGRIGRWVAASLVGLLALEGACSLYGLARVMARPEASFDEILQGIVDLLPPAWLYPEIASARIVLDGTTYATASFLETPHRQVADVVVNGSRVGFVEVVYREERLALDEGPFLAEAVCSCAAARRLPPRRSHNEQCRHESHDHHEHLSLLIPKRPPDKRCYGSRPACW